MESSVATHTEDITSSADTRALLRAPVSERSRGGQRGSILARMLLLGDALAALTAAVIGGAIVSMSPSELLVTAICTTVAWPAVAFTLGLYSSDTLRFWASGVSEVPKALTAIVLFAWPMLGITALAGSHSPGAATAAIVLGTAVLSPLARASVRAKLHRELPLRQRAVIVGSGVVAGRLVDKMRVHDQYGLLPVGLLDDAPHEVGTPDLIRLGTLADLDQVIAEFDIDRVVIAFSRAGHEELLHCIRVCRGHGVSVDVVPRLFEFLDGARALDHVGGLPLLSIGSPQLTRSSKIAKRALDFSVALALIVALLPLGIVIAMAIKLESRGPVFFRQPRVGRGLGSFDMLKFRSMYIDAPLQLNDEGVMVKGRHDARITRVGRLLRRLSLDEMPQLVNVLRGEMSLVGPRPLIPQEAATLEQSWHVRRFDLHPGMTGPWQIQGRSETPFQEMIRLDYQYVDGWSLARDIEILMATVPAVLSGRGAY